jgi:hypothetical protein
LKNKNKYIRRSRISEVKFREIIKCFSLDIEANKAAVLASLNRNTINRHYMLIRRLISQFCEVEGRRLGLDSARTDGVKAANESMIFGICLVNDRIYTEIIHHNAFQDDYKSFTSQKELELFLASCKSLHCNDYIAVVDYNYNRYIRRNSHIASDKQTKDPKTCDLFWNYTKSRLMKFKGISKSTLYYHLKESEFRFNHRNENLYKLLLKFIRQNPLC